MTSHLCVNVALSCSISSFNETAERLQFRAASTHTGKTSDLLYYLIRLSRHLNSCLYHIQQHNRARKRSEIRIQFQFNFSTSSLKYKINIVLPAALNCSRTVVFRVQYSVCVDQDRESETRHTLMLKNRKVSGLQTASVCSILFSNKEK